MPNLGTDESFAIGSPPDFVWDRGLYSLFKKDGTLLDKGKYAILWQAERGSWKPFRDIFNSNMAPPTAPSDRSS